MSLFTNLFGADAPPASALFEAAKSSSNINKTSALPTPNAATAQPGGQEPHRKAKRSEAAATEAGKAHKKSKKTDEGNLTTRDVAHEPADAPSSGKRAKRKRDASSAADAVAGQPDVSGSGNDEPKQQGKKAGMSERMHVQSSGAQDDAAGGVKRARKSPGKAARLPDSGASGPTAAPAAANGGAPGAGDAAPEAVDDGAAEAPPQLLFTPEQLERTVFVGNVPPAVQHKLQKALTERFSRCGKVESVRLRNVPVQLDSKMPKALQVKAGKVDAERATAIAYVRFASGDSLPAALALNMSLFNGNHLRVDRAAAPAKQGAAGGGVRYDPKLSVFVGNLPFNVLEEDLIAVFNSGAHEPQLEGNVRGVRIVRDRNSNLGKGFAYVLLATRTAALAALGMDGRECKGRAMRVTRVAASRDAAAAPAGGKAEGGGAKSRIGAKRGKADPADWQGPKARAKGTGGKAKAGAGGGVAGRGGVQKKRTDRNGPSAAAQGSVAAPSSVRKGGKRPAVMARKAKALAASGKLSPAQAKAVLAQAAAKVKRDKRKKGKKPSDKDGS